MNPRSHTTIDKGDDGFTPIDLIEQRRTRVESLNELASEFYRRIPAGQEPDPELRLRMSEEFKIIPERDVLLWKSVVLCLHSYRPSNINPMIRKDGSTLLVTHSLELFQKLRAFGVSDSLALAGALLHDLAEDTPATLDDIKMLGDKVQEPFLLSMVCTLTEKRDDDLPRHQQTLRFSGQLAAADCLPEKYKKSVPLVELVDRIDDLVDIGYLIDRPDLPSEEARSEIAAKIAKCEILTDAVSKGWTDSDIRRIKGAFDDLVGYVIRTAKISNAVLETARSKYR